MAKRLSKIDPAALSASDQLLNFVLKNHSVVLARPLSVESGAVKVKNTKGHVLHLPLDQIDEIWSDVKVS